MAQANNKDGSKTRSEKNGAARKAPPQSDSLERVRELLIGRDIRSQEQRTSKLERQWGKELSAAQAEAKKQLDAGLHSLAAELEDLDERLQAEQARRRKDCSALSKRITALGATFDQKLSRIRQSAAKSNRSQREQTELRCKELRAEFESQYAGLVEEIEAEFVELKSGKADRAALSELLGDLAKRLGGGGKQRS